MHNFRKQIAFLFGAIALISYVSIRYFPTNPETTTVLSTKEEGTHMQIYLMDGDRSIVPLSIPVNEEMSEEDKLGMMMAYMSGKQTIKGFQPLFQELCTLKEAKVKEGVANLYFDDSFSKYKAEDELRVLEAITWSATQFHDVEQVKLYQNGTLLKAMPKAKTPIPEVLNRSIGINHFETSTTALHSSSSLTVFYTKKIQGQEYMVPKSKRVAASSMTTMQTKVEEILADISASSELSQPLYLESIKVENLKLKDETLTITLNENILGSNRGVKQNVYNALTLSLSTLSGIKNIEVIVDGVSVSPKGIQESAVSIYDLSYNEVAF